MSKYQIQNGRVCLQINLKNPKQLFDSRDPSPFRDRDLDDHAVRYLMSSAEEFSSKTEFKITIYFSDEKIDPVDLDSIPQAVKNFFEEESRLSQSQLQLTLRRGQLFTLVGLGALMVCLFLAQILYSWFGEGTWGLILREGLTIMGWVAMWRPLELFLYDWWPILEKRRRQAALSRAPVDLKRS